MITISTILTFLFLLLANLHFYWGFGGRWGYFEALPTNEEGAFLFLPGFTSCMLVGVGLATMGLAYAWFAGIIPSPLSLDILQYAVWVIPFIFLGRSIGEFKYVGFFKRVKDTKFAQLDTRIYAPLCLVIAILGLMLLF